MKNKPGHGKKICKSCKDINNACAKICKSCETPFTSPANLKRQEDLKNKNIKKKVIVPDIYSGYHIKSTIFTPAGAAPIPLKDNPSNEDVIEWADKIRLHFLEKEKIWMLNNAIKYYLRYKYEDKELKKYCNIIDNIQDIKIIEITETNNE
jgi:hypothetical protein